MASPVVLVLITFFSITAIAASSSSSSSSPSRCINNNNNNFNSSMIIRQQEEEEEEGCVLVADEDHSEFLMDSHISSSSRMLLDPGGPGTGGTFDPRKAVYMCGKYIPYTSCLPKSNSGKPISEPCSGQYNNQNRGCPG